MRVLTLSNIEWSDSNAFGNTMSNFFTDMEDVELASLYRRSSKPQNSVCKKYYKISNSSIVKNFLSPKKIGGYFEMDARENSVTQVTTDTEQKAIGLIHRLKLNSVIYAVEDMLFAIKSWDNEKFRAFIKEYNPEIVFSFAKASKTHLLFLNTIKKYCPECKHVSFIVDDIYAAFSSKKYKKIISEQLKMASKIYAITPSLARKYEELFDVEIDVLTKGCDFSLPVMKKHNSVKTIVYAGNLLYGRDKTLIKLGEEINKHNQNSDNKIVLKIYSPTVVDDGVKNAMNIMGASEFMGAKPYSEIVEILNSSDVVLHVESFDEQQKKVVMHSFSTKITDCMQSGSVLFSIGPEDVASMEATREIDGAFCAVSYDEIGDIVKKIAESDLYDNAKRIRNYAEEHFSIEKIRQKIAEDFKKII